MWAHNVNLFTHLFPQFTQCLIPSLMEIARASGRKELCCWQSIEHTQNTSVCEPSMEWALHLLEPSQSASLPWQPIGFYKDHKTLHGLWSYSLLSFFSKLSSFGRIVSVPCMASFYKHQIKILTFPDWQLATHLQCLVLGQTKLILWSMDF